MAGKVTKTVNGKEFGPEDFAHVPNEHKPSTWKLRLAEEPGQAPTAPQVGRAVAALSPGGFRGRKVDLTPQEKVQAVAKVRAAWRKANPDKKDDEMPMTIHLEAPFADALPTEDFNGVEIMETGEHTDMFGQTVNFTGEDLDSAEKSWQELGDSVVSAPIRLGTHDEKGQIKLSSGAVAGWATNVRRSGDKLLADIRKVPKQVADLMRAGQFRKRSAGLHHNFEWDGKQYPWLLDHVAFLGDKAPAIRTLNDVIALYSEQERKGMTIVVFEEEQKTSPKEPEGRKTDMKEIAKLLNLSEDASEDQITEAITSLSGEITGLEAELEKARKEKAPAGTVQLSQPELVQLQADAAAGKAAKAALDELKKETSFEKWQGEGKILPSQVEIMMRAYDADPVQFAADMEKAQQLVVPGAAGAAQTDNENPNLVSLAQAKMKEEGKSGYEAYRQALTQVANENPTLAGASA